MKFKQIFSLFLILASLIIASGCRASSEAPEGETAMSIPLTSTAFTEGGTIPKKYTCDDADLSPALAWSGVPEGTRSLALIADDPDAPVGTWVHWVLYDLPADLTSLPEGAQGMGIQGNNDFRRSGYGGPCPPKGSPHRYYFKLYALDTQVNLKSGASKADVEKAMKGHILAQGQLMGKYGR
jgi:Raf kinase inhibitor-like YbhB/YbcL family protein